MIKTQVRGVSVVFAEGKSEDGKNEGLSGHLRRKPRSEETRKAVHISATIHQVYRVKSRKGKLLGIKVMAELNFRPEIITGSSQPIPGINTRPAVF